MGWLNDICGITDDVLSVVTTPTKAVTGILKDLAEEIADDIKG